MTVLGPAGYDRVTLAGRPVAEQVALFARATHVVGLHGAGLANFAFAPAGARLLEIFPRTYGTTVYHGVAAGLGCGYATYVTHDVSRRGDPRLDDVHVDVAEFARLCGPLL